MSTSVAEHLLLGNRFVAIASAGFALEDVHLRAFRGTERLGEPFRYEARIASRDPIRNFARIPGQAITVGMVLKGSATRFFNGVVTRFEYLGLDDTRRPHYAAEIRPWLCRLALRRNSRVFQERTSVEIATAIFGEHRGSFRDRTGGRLPRREYCVQHGETDLDFVSRLLEEDGVYYHFLHTEQRHELVLIDDAARHPACSPEVVETHQNLRQFRHVDDVFWHWRERAELTSAKVVLDDYDPEKPTAELAALAEVMPVRTGGVPVTNSAALPAPRDGGGPRVGTVPGTTQPGGGAPLAESYAFPGRYRERADGEFRAGIRAEEIACRAYRVVVEGSARQVTAGSVFRAANPFDIADKAMAPPPDERFLAIAVDFEVLGDLGAAGGGSDGGPPAFYRSTVEALPAATQFRPPLRTPRPASGPQTALVVGRPGETITTDRLGRIKVQFPWDREGRRDEGSSCWIRVAQSWAGKGFGGLVTPRVGQEVLVEFLHGDPDRPVVAGVLYNGANRPPESLPDRATRSTFRTRTDGRAAVDAYNELRFEDRAGAESVHLRAQRNHTVEVKRLFALSAEKGAAISSAGASVVESGFRPGAPMGSRIEVTPEGIALRVVGAGGDQSLLIGADGITISGSGIRLLSNGPILGTSPVLPMPPQLARPAMLAVKQAAVQAQARRTGEAAETERDQA